MTTRTALNRGAQDPSDPSSAGCGAHCRRLADTSAWPCGARDCDPVPFRGVAGHVCSRKPSIRSVQVPEIRWAEFARRAPQMASTMARYLDQVAVSARPNTVTGIELTSPQFADCVTVTDPACHSMALVRRAHFEDCKCWLGRRPSRHGTRTATAVSGCLGLLHVLRTDHRTGLRGRPLRVPIFAGDFPSRDEPNPKFLDDPTAAKFIAALACRSQPAPTADGRAPRRHRDPLRRTRRARRQRDGHRRRHHWLGIPVGRQAPQRPLNPTLPTAR